MHLWWSLGFWIVPTCATAPGSWRPTCIPVLEQIDDPASGGVRCCGGEETVSRFAPHCDSRLRNATSGGLSTECYPSDKRTTYEDAQKTCAISGKSGATIFLVFLDEGRLLLKLSVARRMCRDLRLIATRTYETRRAGTFRLSVIPRIKGQRMTMHSQLALLTVGQERLSFEYFV